MSRPSCAGSEPASLLMGRSPLERGSGGLAIVRAKHASMRAGGGWGTARAGCVARECVAPRAPGGRRVDVEWAALQTSDVAARSPCSTYSIAHAAHGIRQHMGSGETCSIPSHCIPPHLSCPHPIPSYRTPSHPISSHPIPSHPIPPHPAPSIRLAPGRRTRCTAQTAVRTRQSSTAPYPPYAPSSFERSRRVSWWSAACDLPFGGVG